MPAYKDKRNGKVYWRYRKWIKLLDGKRVRIKGKGALNTKESAEQAEHDHVERLLHPEKAIARASLAAEMEPKPRGLTISKLIDLHTKGGTHDGAELEPYSSGSPNADHSRALLLEAWVRPRFGHMEPHEITQAHLNAFRNEMRKLPGKREGTKAADQTVKNKCHALTGLIAWAVEEKIIRAPDYTLTVDVKPTKAVRADDDPEVLPVEDSDVSKLLKAAWDARYRAAIRLATEAGLRIGEIIGALRTDIITKDGVRGIMIERSISARNVEGLPKGKITRFVPLWPSTIAEIERVPKLGFRLIAPLDAADKRSRNNPRLRRTHLTYSALNKAIKAVYKRAGVPFGFTGRNTINVWHSLRHTYGTRLVADGVHGELIQRLMGHKDYRTTQRYIRVTAKQLGEAMARVAASRK